MLHQTFCFAACFAATLGFTYGLLRLRQLIGARRPQPSSRALLLTFREDSVSDERHGQRVVKLVSRAAQAEAGAARRAFYV